MKEKERKEKIIYMITVISNSYFDANIIFVLFFFPISKIYSYIIWKFKTCNDEW